MSKIEVSVLVATYNPNKEKLLYTLASIVCQKDIALQIVITDDGSKEDFFDEIEAWFVKNKITDFQFVKNDNNVGTVKNINNGLRKCTGKYVKLISPGDMLATETVLREWIDYMDKYDAEWSFSDAVYYRNENGNMVPEEERSHPQNVHIYEKRNIISSKKYYLIYNDICLGAATLCKRCIMEKYLSVIVEKVIYAEDNIYRIMMADGINAHYYNRDTILYENGQGISTSKSDVWSARLKNDWDATDEIICRIDTSYKREYNRIGNKIARRIYAMRYKLSARKTRVIYNKEYMGMLYDYI